MENNQSLIKVWQIIRGHNNKYDDSSLPESIIDAAQEGRVKIFGNIDQKWVHYAIECMNAETAQDLNEQIYQWYQTSKCEKLYLTAGYRSIAPADRICHLAGIAFPKEIHIFDPYILSENNDSEYCVSTLDNFIESINQQIMEQKGKVLHLEPHRMR